MKGSNVSNIKFDPSKQKLMQCAGCHQEMVVGKFSKNAQRCENCTNPVSKPKSNGKMVHAPQIVNQNDEESFASRLSRLAGELGFSVTDKRLWRKKYAISDGGVATIHIMIEPSIAGGKPRIDYFSLNIQRAVGTLEDFRKFMQPDAASDCEVLAGELGEIPEVRPQIGFQKCDKCGVPTDEFGVATKTGQVLCITPNNCFKNQLTGAGAEAEA